MSVSLKEKYKNPFEIFSKINKIKNLSDIDINIFKSFRKEECETAYKEIIKAKRETFPEYSNNGDGAIDYKKAYEDVQEKLDDVKKELQELEKAKQTLDETFKKYKNEVQNKIILELKLKSIDDLDVINYYKGLDLQVNNIAKSIGLTKASSDISEKVKDKLNVLKDEVKVEKEQYTKFAEKIKTKIIVPLEIKDENNFSDIAIYQSIKREINKLKMLYKIDRIENISNEIEQKIKGLEKYPDEVQEKLLKPLDININNKSEIERYINQKQQILLIAKFLKTDQISNISKSVELEFTELVKFINDTETNILKPLSITNIDDIEKIEFYKVIEEKITQIAKLLNIDVNTSNWFRKTVKPVEDKLAEIKKLKDDIDKYQKMLNTLGINDLYDQKSLLTLQNSLTNLNQLKSSYKNDNLIEAINKKNDELNDIIKIKEIEILSEQNKVADITKKVSELHENYKSAILTPLRIANIEDKETLKKYSILSNFFGLQEFSNTTYTFKKYNELKNLPEYQIVFSNIQDLMNNNELPDYIKNLIVFLKILQIDLSNFYNKVKDNKDFIVPSFSLDDVSKTLNYLSNIPLLKENLSQNLKQLDKTIFYKKFLNPNLKILINSISSIYCYSNIEYPNSIEIVKVFYNSQSLKKEFHQIYKDLQLFLLYEFDIQLITVNLFIDSFDVNIHEMIEFSDVDKLPYYKEHIKKLNNGIIYDLNSVGVKSISMDINNKPKVIYKQ